MRQELLRMDHVSLIRNEEALLDNLNFQNFFQLLEQGAFDQDEDILFVHTGGAGALFAVEMV